jgi:hypothetical protein
MGTKKCSVETSRVEEVDGRKVKGNQGCRDGKLLGDLFSWVVVLMLVCGVGARRGVFLGP